MAKPGTETNNYGSTYRPRPQGDRPVRPQSGVSARPLAPKAPRLGGVASGMVSAPVVMPTRDTKSFSAPAKKKTFEKT